MAPTPANRARWSPKRFLEAPHRLGFSAAALVLGLSGLWWALVLCMRFTGSQPPLTLPEPLAHALLMTWGFMPLFIVGFLFTAGPRWLQAAEVSAAQLAPSVSLYVGGVLLIMLGFHAARWLSVLGGLALTLAWASLCWRYSRLWRAGRSDDKTHASVILCASWSGLAGLVLTLVGLAFADDNVLRSGIYIGLWCFIATVFAAVSHRMIPFFTASALPALDAWRPLWLLWCLVGALWWLALGQVLDLWFWPLPAVWRTLQAALEAFSASIFLWLAVRWGLVQSLKIRLLAMLHGGFLWLGIGLALQAMHHIWMAVTGESSPLGLAPLHALTMGYLGATLFAMATRVAAGHSGRSLVADNYAWALYVLVQLAIIIRLWAALPWSPNSMLLIAIALWVAATCGWALRYVRWFGLPRQDGRPG
ncbi:NnrS family protein [Curvibacter sp. APW13]|uniref:NnrS family protein n=1 Tax=Curvibacter sp. APW13 TaxID=3077236 RepID=UPI0028DFC679|nr:NnrS family protein [Curvibacter sp. APW13]MDT8991879.1 NnrS family protein [Curvibacter sp. APW13]